MAHMSKDYSDIIGIPSNFGAFRDFLNYSTPVFEIERAWDKPLFEKWIKENWSKSLIISLVYVIGIFGGQLYMQNKQRFELRWPLIIWNIGLSIFSILGTLRTASELVDVLYTHGFYYATCVPSYYDKQVISFWLFLFMISKAFELGDTVFIVLRKQQLIFLHWYHHISVMVYVWYSYSERNAPGRWFIPMNFFVHSVMYTYYSLRAMKIRIPKIVAMCVTGLQILQMVVGLGVAIYTYYIRNMVPGGKCHTNSHLLLATFVMYGSYFALFTHFFMNSYMTATVPPKTTSGTFAVSDKQAISKKLE